jgi:putative GTP pyrophosphokinase
MKKNYDFSKTVKNPYAKLSKSQLDKLGERLKNDNITEDDLRTLNDYRLSFGETYNTVIKSIRTELKLEPTGRPAKSTTSISDKLRRESIRLTQIQDIAGCRLVVENLKSQEDTTKSLTDLFPGSLVLDRRIKPSHGYRAVHVVVSVMGNRIEVQVRTALQHNWAELCEKLSDTIDPAIKYGGGNSTVREVLDNYNQVVIGQEDIEKNLIVLRQAQVELSQAELSDEERGLLRAVQLQIETAEQQWKETTQIAIEQMRVGVDLLERKGKKNHVVPD